MKRALADYFLGAIVFNMAFAEGLFAAALLAVLLWTWPNPPWDAFDLLFRPLTPEDFAS